MFAWCTISTEPLRSKMTAQKTDHIKRRRSVRRFRPDPVPDEVIRDILDCGHMAPSALNKQPWLLGAVTDPVLLRTLADLVEDARFIQQSTVCFSVFTKADEAFFLEDGCAATMNIIHACEAHGVASCWVAGAGQDFVKQVGTLLDVPEEYNLVALVAAGYSDKVPVTNKKPLDDVIFINRCGSVTGKTLSPTLGRRLLNRKLRHLVRGLLLKWF